MTVFDVISDHMMTFLSLPVDKRFPAKPKVVYVKYFAKADDTSILDLLDFLFLGFTSLSFIWMRQRELIKLGRRIKQLRNTILFTEATPE